MNPRHRDGLFAVVGLAGLLAVGAATGGLGALGRPRVAVAGVLTAVAVEAAFLRYDDRLLPRWERWGVPTAALFALLAVGVAATALAPRLLGLLAWGLATYLLVLGCVLSGIGNPVSWVVPATPKRDVGGTPTSGMERTEVRREWDRIAETYARRRNPDGPDAALLGRLLERLPEEPLVLDVGCGDGARTLANLPADSVGLDISRRGLELAGETAPEARLLQADMAAIPLASSSVDGVTAYHAVFHVPRAEHPAVYREFARVLKPGGVLLATLPGGRFETVRSGWMGGRMFFSTPGRGRTLEALADAGFENVETVSTDDPLGSDAEFVFAERR